MRKVLLLVLFLLPTIASAAETCPQISSTLRRGMSGEEVRQLQTFLIGQDLLDQELATGYFGVYTEAAVQKFQCSNMQLCSGSPSENGYGQVGPATRAKIIEICAGGTAGATTSDTPEVIVTELPPISVEAPQNSCPYYVAPDCTGGTLVTNGTDPNGCFLGYRCVVSATTTREVCASGSCQSPGADIPPLSCTLSSVTIRSGQSYAFYSMPFAANCADVSQVRTCTSGTLSGDPQYQFSICL